MGREAREDPGEGDDSRGPGGREDRRNDRDGDHKSCAASHVDGRDEKAQGHPQEERQERGAEEDPDARQSKVRHRNGEDEADGRGHEEQDHVENRVPHEHPEERPPEPHRKDSGHRDQVVAHPGRPLQVLPTEESEGADAEAVEEDAHVQEQNRIRERGVCEQSAARDRDGEAEYRDDKREGHEHRLAGVTRVDPEFLFQHEAKEPAHRQAPTSRRNADSRSASPARIWATGPVARSLQSVVPPSSRSKNSNQCAIRSSRRSSFRTRPTKYRYSCAVKYDGGDSTSGTMPTSDFT